MNEAVPQQDTPLREDIEGIRRELERQKNELELLRAHTVNLYRALDMLGGKIEQLMCDDMPKKGKR